MSEAVTACVLIIGNEILSGRTQDVNISHLATTLGGWGIQVRHCRVIPDVEDIIVDTVNEVRGAYDYVFTTGGIGPTHDDITAECIAKAFGVELVEDPDIAARIRVRPAPDDVMSLPFAHGPGTQGREFGRQPYRRAPRFAMDNVYVMAGIPMIMQAMLSSLEGKLRSGPVVHSHSIRAYTGESQIADALSALQDEYSDVDIGSYPFFRDERYGTMLVIRGTSTDLLATVAARIMAAVEAIGETPEDMGLTE
ncbi:MAG: molybdenum cofactor biosynthesis protein [Pseudomonadota bacterium]|nr:MAG: molybdenum cofactor biosynthesis protein [Pseudomonadota bacterium]